jgi:endoglucanase
MRRVVAVLAAVVMLVASLVTAPAANGRAKRVSTNPLAGGPWGIYKGSSDGVWPAYQAAGGTNKTLLKKIALRSRGRWFTSFIPASDVQSKVHAYVNELQQDTQNPDVLVPLATFRQFPNHESNKDQPISQSAYKAWYNGVAAGIGNARAVVILEPDLAVILKDAWRPDIREQLVAYAAQKLAALPNTTVYIEAGAADWLTVAAAARLLKRSGVAHVRGFALNGTHYTTTVSNIKHGRQIVAKLAAMGIPNKHFVIDTADNGHGFTFAQYRQRHPGSDVTNPIVCQTKSQRVCETLGIPPTWKVGLTKWHLPGPAASMARRWVDAYLWYNRPWLDHNAGDFKLDRALPMARTTPFAMCLTPCG